MAPRFKGKISLDIRDSVPDWDPYLAPKAAEGAPNVLRYTAPFPFTGGTIEKVVVDLSGEHFVDHEAQVIGWFMKD